MMGHLVHGMPRDRRWASMGATGHRDTIARRVGGAGSVPKTREAFGHRGSA